MSYTPTNWATGDVITAEKLNNMESGIVNGDNILFVNVTTQDGQTFSCDKTYAEIMQAIDNDKDVVVVASNPQSTAFTSQIIVGNNSITAISTVVRSFSSDRIVISAYELRIDSSDYISSNSEQFVVQASPVT